MKKLILLFVFGHFCVFAMSGFSSLARGGQESHLTRQHLYMKKCIC